MNLLGPFRLRPWFSNRVWGTYDLSPWYSYRPENEPVGEVWLTGDECEIETGGQTGRKLAEVAREMPEPLLGPAFAAQAQFPLLVKMLFPRDKLSVQVHPDDALAQEFGDPRGKTECWYVVQAEPGATISLGLKPGTTPEQVEQAIHDHTLEHLLQQVPVSAGDMVYVDAGTVHAIGAGVVILETQQNSDLTYRMYDYGRPRELHLEKSMRAMRTQTAAGKVPPEEIDSRHTRLIDERYFAVSKIDVAPSVMAEISKGDDSADQVPHCVFAMTGAGVLEAPGEELIAFAKGEMIIVPAATRDYKVSSQGGMSCILSIPKGPEQSL